MLCSRLVVAAEAVPAVEVERLGRQLDQALGREPGQDGVERLLLADAGLEGLVAAEAGRDAERLAAVLAELGEGGEEELLVRDRLTDLEGGVPRGEHRQVVVVEVL